MGRTYHMNPHYPLTAAMFDTNDLLRFDLENPEQVVVIPTRYNSRIQMEKDINEIVEKMKKSRERFLEMGREKTLSHSQVRSTLLVANYIVESMNVIVKRYYLDREEGLRVREQREHAAVRDTGMAKLYKHIAITLKYNMDLREKWFAFKVAQRNRQMYDGLDKLKRYSVEALSISNGNEPLWGTTLD
ncbi:hypothetical protein FCIRC_9699 [Fusarium circinatum]|uniref:Uncharacterized protein n=1 Tax=Fusarium circinatum TaxID=48490 RepID=A0A8H5TFM7_FUSCI|nr:hypothetical protein FCIRC_9699 [Fusarium circinatum]